MWENCPPAAAEFAPRRHRVRANDVASWPGERNRIWPDGRNPGPRVTSPMATAVKKIPTSGGPRALPGRKNPRAKIAVPDNRGIKIVRAVTIRKPAAELYAFWRQLENLMQIIKHRVTITTTSPEESHWVVSAPTGDVEWDSLIIND